MNAMEKASLCNYSDFLATIFGRDKMEVRKKLGLPYPYGACLNCGEPLKRTNPAFCSRECHQEYAWIKVECEECGKLQDYYAHQIIWARKRGKQNHFFCSKECQGKWFAREYGIGSQYQKDRGIKPIGRQRKHDYQLIGMLVDLKYSDAEISKLLNIPSGSIYSIRKRLMAELVKA